ncbi:MAG: hypothetical protein O2984_03455 [Bacteroidetes bacterium]|nr:hypothetical protein [Bacteroidota bacterium]
MAPYHAGCHYRLGRLAAHQGLRTQSMLAYTMSVLVDPVSDNAITRLVEMENMLAGNFEKKEFEIDLSNNGGESYPEIDMALENNFANNSAYKYPHKKVDYAFARHLHLALTELKDNKSLDGFWADTYLPFYSKVLSDGNFNYLINTMVIQVEDPKVQAYLNKKSNRLKTIAFIEKMKVDWDELNGEKVFPMKAGEQKTKLLYSDARLVYGAGDFDGTGFKGYTEFYNQAGGLSAYGEFNSQYKKEGTWHYFYEDGNTKEISDWSNGDLEGWYHEFNQNGTRARSISLKNNQRDGLSLDYDGQGVLQSSMEYVEGELQGNIMLYHENGEVKRTYTYKDGNANGVLLEYAPNGVKSREAMLPVDVGYNHGYYRTIAFDVPEGYEVKNLDDLNMDITYERDGEQILAFVSRYEVDGKRVKVIIDEVYRDHHFPVEEFENFRAVINGAADFNKLVLVFGEN